jgi:putative membrane protein
MLIKVVAHWARGFFMGAADVVPGVSGGTIALVLGIYHRLIDNVRTGARSLGSLVTLDVKGFLTQLRSLEWSFVLPLLVGIGTAVLALSHTLETLLEDEPVRMAGLFFGLVVGSVIVAARLLKGGWDPARLGVAAAVAAVTFVVLGLQGGRVQDPALWVYFGSGMIAICAMILPGISGSFLLLMMGMYANVLGIVNDRDLLPIAVFGLGAVIGLALFSQVLHWGLVNHERTLLAGLVGLMVGSLRILWPWPDGLGSEDVAGTALGLPEGDVGVPVALAVVGLVVVLGITWVSERLEGRDDEDLVEELTEP